MCFNFPGWLWFPDTALGISKNRRDCVKKPSSLREIRAVPSVGRNMEISFGSRNKYLITVIWLELAISFPPQYTSCWSIVDLPYYPHTTHHYTSMFAHWLRLFAPNSAYISLSLPQSAQQRLTFIWTRDIQQLWIILPTYLHLGREETIWKSWYWIQVLLHHKHAPQAAALSALTTCLWLFWHIPSY